MKICHLELLAVSLVIPILAGCNSDSAPSVPGPEPPVLSHPFVQEGAPVVLRLQMPPSKWKLDETAGPIDTDGNWAWYVRVNGKDYRCRVGLAPLSGLSTEIDLRDDLVNPPAWPPGAYRVSFVLKDISVVQREDSSRKRQLAELESETIEIRIVAKKDS